MSTTEQALAAGPPVSLKGPRRPISGGRLRGADFRWAIAFMVPHAAVFLLFVVYPFGYALWLASKPPLYAELIADPFYLPTVVNTCCSSARGESKDVFGLADVRLLHAPALVDQGFIAGLYFALRPRLLRW